MLETFYVLDNVVSPQQQKMLSDIAGSMNWFLSSDVTYGNKPMVNPEDKCMPALHHMLFSNGKSLSPYDIVYNSIMRAACDVVNINFSKCLVGKSLLQFPLNNSFVENSVDPLHVDLYYPHMVFLYYVYDSDGDTIITKKKYDDTVDPNVQMYYQDFEVLEKIKPKKGRIVLFNGSYYHTAEQPKENLRCIVNYSFL